LRGVNEVRNIYLIKLIKFRQNKAGNMSHESGTKKLEGVAVGGHGGLAIIPGPNPGQIQKKNQQTRRGRVLWLFK